MNSEILSATGDHHDDLKAHDNDVDHEVESGEDETEDEVQEELETLQSDNTYFDFVAETLHAKPIPTDDDPTDVEYVPDEVVASAEAEVAEGDEDASSSDDSSVYEEASEEVVEEVQNTREDVPVPPEALKEAAARFPPFWRTKAKIAHVDQTDYKSDEDSDFEPEPEEEASEEMDDGGEQVLGADVEVIDLVSSSEDDEEDDADIEKDEMDSLVEMAEDQLVIRDEEIVDVSNEVIDQPAECLARSIVEFDPATYREEDDPDYIQPAEPADVESQSSSSEESEPDDMEE